jgi:hypothetical protein
MFGVDVVPMDIPGIDSCDGLIFMSGVDMGCNAATNRPSDLTSPPTISSPSPESFVQLRPPSSLRTNP